jgi:RNA polymerase sigma-70 factor (ECF subfamily)
MPENASSADQVAVRSRALVARITANDRSAEQELWHTYARGLRFIVYKRVEDHHACDDILQEAFRIAIVQLRAGRLENPDVLAAFLRGIALNVISSAQRGAVRENPTDPADIAELAIDDDQSSPLETVVRAETIGFVRTLISELNVARDRALLWKYYVLDQDKASICEQLSLDPNHFDRVLHRAKERLKALAGNKGLIDSRRVEERKGDGQPA